MRRPLALALLVLGVAACNKTQPAQAPLDAQLEPALPGSHPPVLPAPPDPELQNGNVGRSPRRISVDQLDLSIQVALGGRRWSQIDNLAASLGRPDYATTTSEAAEPNLVFAKFLEDGAREVCIAQANAEVAQSNPELRVLTHTVPGAVGDLRKLSPDQVNTLLQELSLRFWGAPLTGDELTRWAGFFIQAATTAETKGKRSQALAVLCIALMTDERFLTY